MPHKVYGRLCALHLTLGLLVSANSFAEAPVPEAPSEIRQAVNELMSTWDVPGAAVAKVEQGRVIWAEGFGRAGEDRPVTRETVFNVASLTKPLFATMTLHAAEAGELELDAPLARHWTDPDIADDPRHRQLTARLALSHQTGLPNWRGGGELHFQFDPGTRHEYSGEGFEYVRRALERASGESMTELMTRHVLTAAGMQDTVFGWQESLEKRFAGGYDEASEPLDTGHLTNRGPNAAANTFTTVLDYARFAAWVARGAGLEAELFGEMTNPQAAHDNPAEFFSLGWRVTQLPGQTVISHDGREDGVRTQVYVLPDVPNNTGKALVILTNSSNGELLIRPLTALALARGDALLAQVDRDTWHYVRSIPPAVQPRMLDFIARSPSFTSKLLHAVQSGVIDDMDSPLAATAARRIEPFVLAYHKGELTTDRVGEVFALLTRTDGEEVSLREAFDHEWLARWTEALALPDA